MNLVDIFQNESLWKKYYPDYKIRKGQIELSTKIYDTIINKSILIAEAGTGTGKTIAYLLPAILASLENTESKVLISTETKNLQNQILKKDIPLLENLLGIKIPSEICLGSNNYICKRRFNQYINSSEINPKHIPYLDNFIEWNQKTQIGIILNYPEELPKDLISQVIRIPELCLGNRCPNFSTSYYFVEREKWKKAKVLIVNHHLLSAHIESNLSLLPNFNIAIIDEAHSFPDIYRDSSIKYFSIKELEYLSKKFNLEKILEKPLKQFIEFIKKNYKKDTNENKIRITQSLDISELFEIVNSLEICKRKLEEELKSIQDLFSSIISNENKSQEIEFQSGITRINHTIEILNIFYEGPINNRVHYIEINSIDIKFCISMVDTGEMIQEKFLKYLDSCIFTSATISINKNFQYFAEKIGFYFYDNENAISIPSPFNYKKQALIYLPKNLNDPNTKEYLDQVTDEIFRLIELVQGNILVLFTSKNNLNLIYNNLLNKYSRFLQENKFNIYSQEISGAKVSLEKYIQDDKGILFGLDSFRQGIDLAGDKLKCVILVKLPFSVPAEPIQLARIEMEMEKQRNPFLTIQIPEMIIKLKQSIGRLIRTENDKGIIAIFDSRIYTKQYGSLILKSLPDCSIIDSYIKLEDIYKSKILK